jgi:hypothetical protein
MTLIVTEEDCLADTNIGCATLGRLRHQCYEAAQVATVVVFSENSVAVFLKHPTEILSGVPRPTSSILVELTL